MAHNQIGDVSESLEEDFEYMHEEFEICGQPLQIFKEKKIICLLQKLQDINDITNML